MWFFLCSILSLSHWWGVVLIRFRQHNCLMEVTVRIFQVTLFFSGNLRYINCWGVESTGHTLSRRWTALQGWTGNSFKAFSLSVHLAGWNSSQQKQILPSPKSTLRGKRQNNNLIIKKDTQATPQNTNPTEWNIGLVSVSVSVRIGSGMLW